MRDMDWDHLTRVVAGDGTAGDRRELDAWAAEVPERVELLAAVRAIASEPGAATGAERLEELLASAKRDRRTQPDDEAQAPALGVVQDDSPAMPKFALPHVPRMQRVATLAAVGFSLAVAVAGGWLLLRSRSSQSAISSQPTPKVLATARGQRLSLRLPDGTLTTLAPTSTLRIVPGYGGRDRIVELEGEAAFTVVHDAARPFMVRAAGVLVRDVGTRFIVRRYAEDSTTDVVVAEGQVAVHGTRRDADSLLVSRGERARASAAGLALTRGVPLDRYFAWTEGRLVFQETPLRDVVAQLDRWYDIEVHLAPAGLGARKVSASVEDEPAGDVLTMLAASLDLELSRSGRVFTLSAR